MKVKQAGLAMNGPLVLLNVKHSAATPAVVVQGWLTSNPTQYPALFLLLFRHAVAHACTADSPGRNTPMLVGMAGL
jgi:hypothetical protein